jgi:ribosomal protein S18 acetylase RimI-like enzyme
MDGMTLTLRPMTQTEFDATVDAAFASFVDTLVRNGQVRAEDAAEEIRRQRDKLLPDGLETDHMLLFTGEVDGEAVGWLWLAVPGAPFHPDMAWVYDVQIDEAHRGKGYGREIMHAGERELIARGVRKVGLNVFGTNRVAIGLYERLGYEVMSQQMSKPLGG